MEFIALGDTEDIAASCHFLDIQGTGLVLDAGVDPRHDGPESLPRFGLVHDDPGRYVDHALVTHAHHDHIGALPVLVKEFPHVMAHMTDATKRLIEFLLPASARLQQRKLEQGETEHEPLFTEDDLGFHSHIYLTHQLGAAFDVTGTGAHTDVTARFHPAGHILGSVGVELTFQEDGRHRRVFYTSDTNLQPQSILPGGEYPDATDVLILESTLGSDEEAAETSRPEETEKFASVLQETLSKGGTVLIPVFVMGRAQETLALLDQLKNRGAIPHDVPIYTAGSMRAIADLYDQTRETTPRLDPSFRVFDVDQKRLPRSRSGKDEAFDGPAICVVSSGMMFEPTLSNLLARRLVSNENDAILLVGYAKEDTPAHRLMQAAAEGPGTEVILSHQRGPQPVRCTVDSFRFSGHSNRNDLLALVEHLTPEEVILVHGETSARAWMAEHIREAHPNIEVHVPGWGESIKV
jgi:Cft2 family RNA processing exonuclease